MSQQTRVMLIGALPVGSGGPRMPMYPAGGPGPTWRTNFTTSATTVTEVPQNLMRVTSDGPPFRQSSVGERAVPLEAHMLGRLGNTEYSMDEYRRSMAASDPYYVETTQMMIRILAFGQRLMGASVGAYHGYKRSGGKTSHAVGWGVAGALFPVLTVGVGLYQGLAQRK